IIYQNSLTLCGSSFESNGNSVPNCDWSDDIVQINGHVYIAQPSLNRILVFDESQLAVSQVIATDPQPKRLWVVQKSGKESQIWVLCHGNNNYFDESLKEPEQAW